MFSIDHLFCYLPINVPILQFSQAINFQLIEETLKWHSKLKGAHEFHSFRVDMRRNINHNDIESENTRIFNKLPRDIEARQFVGHVALATHANLNLINPHSNKLDVSFTEIPDIILPQDESENLAEIIDSLAPDLVSKASVSGLPTRNVRHLATLFESLLRSFFRLLKKYSLTVTVLEPTMTDDDEPAMQPLVFHEFLDATDELGKVQAVAITENGEETQFPVDQAIPSKKTIVERDIDGRLIFKICGTQERAPNF